MSINITLIGNGFILTLATEKESPKSLYFANKEQLEAAVSEILKGVQMTPTAP